MFETQNSGNKTSSGEIGLNIRTHARLKVGQDQVSGKMLLKSHGPQSIDIKCICICVSSSDTHQVVEIKKEPFDISVGVGAFVIGLSQISSFFSSTKIYTPFYDVQNGVRKNYILKLAYLHTLCH